MTRDRWAEWILNRRFGGDEGAAAEMLDGLGKVRDRVLDGAEVRDGETVLDVGCGDGLIAFGALERVGEGGRVIFSDVSQDLLDVSRELADGDARCEFVLAGADDLLPIANESVDVVTTRSVIIYVSDKRAAFGEFSRVLRPGGRLSMFEPINRFSYPEPDGVFLGLDVQEIWPLARRVRDRYNRMAGDEAGEMTGRHAVAYLRARLTDSGGRAGTGRSPGRRRNRPRDSSNGRPRGRNRTDPADSGL
jgi:arsenite methyltransferase